MSVHGSIDVDRPEDWPADVAEVVQEHAGRLRGTTEHASDLELSYDDEGEFLDLLAGRPLRMYHCTRLLDVEVEAIRQHGLRLLSRELMADKIQAAVHAAAITAADGQHLEWAHVFAVGEHDNRQDQICLVLSAQPLHGDRHGIRPLMTSWGGEALSMSSGAVGWRDRLTQIGKPAVVVVDVPFARADGHHAWPGVLKTFVAALMGLQAGASVHYVAPIAGAAVAAVWRPGDAAYDALRAVPR
jgi:hypothetical protein